MARPASKHPTDLELAILKVLWQRGPLPVREVRDALAPARDLAYTSVMTVMNILVDKGYLRRRKVGGAFVYQPRVSEKATVGGMLKDLMGRAFGGSASALLVNLLESGDLDQAELKRLRDLIVKAGGEKS